jgi:hypothetical protein
MWTAKILFWAKFLVAERYKINKVVIAHTGEDNSDVRWGTKNTTIAQYIARNPVCKYYANDWLPSHA